MRIEIKLSDPKYCEGCHLLSYDEDGYVVCNIGYGLIRELHTYRWTRPQECIIENGE